MRVSRRDFVRAAALAVPALGLTQGRPAVPSPWLPRESSIGAALRSTTSAGTPLLDLVRASSLSGSAVPRPPFDQDFLEPGLGKGVPPRLIANPVERLRRQYPHLKRHFVFEYYAWYRTNPWSHWDEAGHTPPTSIAASTMPALGPYDSGDMSVIEQHAEWIAQSGVGAIALSWWGQGSPDDLLTHRIMDVMRAHDIHVTFHLEPYRNDRAYNLADDVLYLLREYGEKRRWDNFLLHEFADGTSAPVLKGFRTILPPTVVDCQGTTVPVADYVPDHVWRAQLDALRDVLRPTFPRFTFLADSLDRDRTHDAGFDGIAIYDSYVRPSTWAQAARTFSSRDLVSSFAINCGFDGYLPVVPRGVCDIPLPFEPPIGPVTWSDDASRLTAEAASRARIAESMQATINVQTDRDGTNERQGFFLVYVNTFNEWHEGTAFEPARPRQGLTAAERAQGYHNPEVGTWRLEQLRTQLLPLLA